MKNINRRSIMKIAHKLYKTGNFETFGKALAASWKRYKLIRNLKKGIAYFSFVKADKTIREAIGSLNGNNFEYKAKGAERKENINIVKFYDIQKRAWRAARVDRLLAVA